MIKECTYRESIELVKTVHSGEYTDKVLGFVFVQANCEVCGPWTDEVLVPLARTLEDDLDLYLVYVDKEWIPFPPPNVPTAYFYVPNGTHNTRALSREGPAEYNLALEDVSRLIKMKNEKISLQDAFYE